MAIVRSWRKVQVDEALARALAEQLVQGGASYAREGDTIAILEKGYEADVGAFPVVTVFRAELTEGDRDFLAGSDEIVFRFVNGRLEKIESSETPVWEV